MDPFRGKGAVVTGGGTGIGRELCLALGRRGAGVAVAGRRLSPLEETAGLITAEGGTAFALQTDVSRRSEVDRLVDAALARFGRLDLMINNAGINMAGEARDLDAEAWQRVMEINFGGVLHGSLAAYQAMARQGKGHIVNIASLAGLVPFPVNGPYTASKHAVVGFSTTLRAEAAGLGVRVSVACPGLVATEIWDKTRIRKAATQDVIRILRIKMMDARAAADAILRGVERNRAVIAFPRHARLLWRLYRLWPPLVTPVGWYMVREFRKIRCKANV